MIKWTARRYWWVAMVGLLLATLVGCGEDSVDYVSGGGTRATSPLPIAPIDQPLANLQPDGSTTPVQNNSPTALSKYAFANACWRVVDQNGKFLNGSDSRVFYVDTPYQAVSYLMRPSALGEYLFYDPQEKFIGSGANNNVVRTKEMTDRLRWTLTHATLPGYFYIHQKGGYIGKSGSQAVLVSTPEEALMFKFERATGCATFPEASVDAIGQPQANWTWPDGALKGFVDPHMHMFGPYGFGGRVFHGEPFNPLGVTQALTDSSLTHGKGGRFDILPMVGGSTDIDFGSFMLQVLNGEGTADTRGWPIMQGWPRYNTTGNQQAYYRWVERSYLAGLRLIEMNIVSMQVFCRLKLMLMRQIEPNWKMKYSCNEEDAFDLQLAKVKELQDYVDAQHGGPGKGWFRIAYSPAQAREIIKNGKLAVVLATETETPFECFKKNSKCTPDYARAKVREYYDKGIRAMFVTHRFDNAFGGALNESIAMSLFNLVDQGEPFEIKNCTPEDYFNMTHVAKYSDFSFGVVPGFLGKVANLLLGLPNNSNLLKALTTYPGVNPNQQVCNKRGLTKTGIAVVDEMMRLGMIFNADHMGHETYKDFYQIALRRQYPFNHVHLNNLGSDEVYLNALKLGGFVGSFPRVLMENGTGLLVDTIQKTCEQFGDYYEVTGKQPACGYTTDVNGQPKLPGPPGGNFTLTYPFKSEDGAVTFTQPKVGQRTIDFAKDGMSHYGMFAEELKVQRQLAGDKVVDSVLRSAEAYIQAWETAERRSKQLPE